MLLRAIQMEGVQETKHQLITKGLVRAAPLLARHEATDPKNGVHAGEPARLSPAQPPACPRTPLVLLLGVVC